MDFKRVRESYERCAVLGDEFFDSFYANLVDQETAIAQLFAETDMQRQNDLIEDGIRHLIAFAEGDALAEARIRDLGRSHNRHYLNVRPEFYPLWVESLMRALREHDAQFTPELETEWRTVIAPGVALMVSLY
jgi:hemoglobin-like flavoprotein